MVFIKKPIVPVHDFLIQTLHVMEVPGRSWILNVIRKTDYFDANGKKVTKKSKIVHSWVLKPKEWNWENGTEVFYMFDTDPKQRSKNV